MTFSEDIIGELPFLREQAESLMRDLATIRRPTGAHVTDPETLQDTPELVTLFTDQRCKIQSATPQSRDETSGEAAYLTESLQVHVPIGVNLVEGDLIEVTASTLDPSLVGKTFRVRELARGTFRTANRWDSELLQ